MIDNATYLKALAYELRWRRLPELDVERALRDVATGIDGGAQSPVHVFGPPERYAASFGRGHSLHRGYVVATAAVFLAVIVVGVASFAELILNADFFSLWSFALMVVGAAAWSVTAILAGAAMDRRLPRNWSH